MNDFSIMNSEFYIPLSKRSKKNGLRVKITSSRSPPIILIRKLIRLALSVSTTPVENYHYFVNSSSATASSQLVNIGIASS